MKNKHQLGWKEELLLYFWLKHPALIYPLSKFLKESPILVLRKAGFLPEGDSPHTSFEDWEHLIAQLTPEEGERIREKMSSRIMRRIEKEKKRSPL